MSFGLSSDAKDRVRQAVDIVELVGDYLQLRREGRGYKALCPWHDDSRPSLQVNPERQSFKCWVCDIGGDVFSFIMKYENVTFPEALQMLADRAGIELPKAGGGGAGGGSGESGDVKRTLYQAMAWAEEQFHKCLISSEGEPARQYLLSRGIQAESFAAYHLGYAPDRWDWLLERARDTRFTPKILESIGLAAPRSNGPGHYDRFRGRVLFSIRDPQGRPVGTGGRILPGSGDKEGAKYVNSPETPLFSKSNLLYGLDHAKDAMTKSRTAVVMEGYTDSLIAQQFGFKNAVAVLGTALGERHIQLLRRFVDRIILVLDGDEAGRRRTDQILELFVAAQVDLRILTLPDALDPCDFLLQRGAEAFETLLGGAVDALDHKLEVESANLGAGSGIHEVNKAIEKVLATLAKAPRLQSTTTAAIRLREEQIIQRMTQRFSIGEARLRDRLAELRRGGTRRTPPPGQVEAAAEPQEVQKLGLAEMWLLQILLQAPELFHEIRGRLKPEQLSCPRRRRIYSLGLALSESGELPTFERLMLEIDDMDVQSVLVNLDEERERTTKSWDLPKQLEKLLGAFRDEAERQSEARAAVPAPPSQSEAENLAALVRLQQRERNRQGISAPTDG